MKGFLLKIDDRREASLGISLLPGFPQSLVLLEEGLAGRDACVFITRGPALLALVPCSAPTRAQ